MLLERGVSGIVFVSGLHADSTTDPGRYQALRQRGLPIVSGQRLPRRASTRRSSATTTWPRWSWRSSHLVSLGHRRIGLAVGPAPVRAGGPQDRRVPRGAAPPPRGGRRRAVGGVLDVQRRGWGDGGRPPRRPRCDRADLRLGPDGARGDPGRAGPRAAGARPTCRWSGYDDSLLVAFTDPPLTTVRQSVQAMGVGRGAGPAGRDLRASGAPGGVRLPARAGGAGFDRGGAAQDSWCCRPWFRGPPAGRVGAGPVGPSVSERCFAEVPRRCRGGAAEVPRGCRGARVPRGAAGCRSAAGPRGCRGGRGAWCPVSGGRSWRPWLRQRVPSSPGGGFRRRRLPVTVSGQSVAQVTRRNYGAVPGTTVRCPELRCGARNYGAVRNQGRRAGDANHRCAAPQG